MSRHACAAALCVLAFSCRGAEGGRDGKKAKKAGGMHGVRVVSVEKAEERRLERRGFYRGELRAEKVVEVAPDVQGRIKKLHADMGSEVKKGDLLLELDRLEMNQLVNEGKARVDVAAASISQAEVALEKALADLERNKPLAAKGLVTPAEMDNLESAAAAAASAREVAKASQVQANASYKNLLVTKKNLKVRAPFDGVVARRYLNEGAMASPSTPVFQLHASGNLFMRIAVPEKDVPFVQESMTGSLVLDALPSRTFAFIVELVSPVIEPTTRTCTVDLLVTPAGEGGVGIKPGMTGQASLLLDQVDGALSIPRDALLRRDEGSVVFVVASGKAEEVAVEIKGEFGDWLWVSGVEEGAEVVVKGQLDLEPGVPVTLASME
ncbi:MAG: efflux RND transporter periplasmic adaptor subunit [Deltaproteobacteria bacterium]|nr:efflux RND transporter periplasmic adaptor subunit [Deltaproteobacteria bacterium]